MVQQKRLASRGILYPENGTARTSPERGHEVDQSWTTSEKEELHTARYTWIPLRPVVRYHRLGGASQGRHLEAAVEMSVLVRCRPPVGLAPLIDQRVKVGVGLE